MKIVQFIPSLNSGGAERFVIDLSNSLASNHKVHLFTLLDINEYGFYKNDLSKMEYVYGSFGISSIIDTILHFRPVHYS